MKLSTAPKISLISANFAGGQILQPIWWILHTQVSKPPPIPILLSRRNLVAASGLPERAHKVHFICGSPPLNFIASFAPTTSVC